MTDSVQRCGCGNEVGKYKHLVQEYIDNQKPLEELYDKLGLILCCRKEMTVLTTLKHYYHFSGFQAPTVEK